MGECGISDGTLMKILAIDHVQLAMPEQGEEKAREFYMHLLGFHEIPKPPDLAKRGGVWFQHGQIQIHLGVDANFQPAKKAHPAFIVDSLNEFIAKFESAGTAIDFSQPELAGFKRIHIFDPFGNRIELMETI